MIRPYNPLPPPQFMHLSNQIPGNINCNITSSVLLLETKSVIRVEHITTCWDLNTGSKAAHVGLRPSPSETDWGPQIIKTQTQEGVGFLLQKEDLLMTKGKLCLLEFSFLSLLGVCRGGGREGDPQWWDRTHRSLQ